MHNLFNDVQFWNPDFFPCFEVLEEHPGCYEMVFIMTDGNFGISLFIPKTEGINAGVSGILCERYLFSKSPPAH